MTTCGKNKNHHKLFYLSWPFQSLLYFAFASRSCSLCTSKRFHFNVALSCFSLTEKYLQLNYDWSSNWTTCFTLVHFLFNFSTLSNSKLMVMRCQHQNSPEWKSFKATAGKVMAKNLKTKKLRSSKNLDTSLAFFPWRYFSSFLVLVNSSN